jgi:hypothetical protein
MAVAARLARPACGGRSRAASLVVVTPPDPDPPPLGIIEVAQGKTATASSVKPANNTGVFTPDKAVDGDPATRFSTAWGSDNQTYTIDLGAIYQVVRVEVDWYTSWATQWAVMISTNGTSFTERYGVTSSQYQPSWVIPFVGVSGELIPTSVRYVRLRLDTRADKNFGFSFYAVRVYAYDTVPPVTSPPTNETKPAITGTFQDGSTLSCSSGAWRDAGGQPILNPAALYQWTADNIDLPGATSQTLLLTSAHVGKTIGCKVTVQGVPVAAIGGKVVQPKVVTPPPVDPPTVATAPTISGPGVVGQPYTGTLGTATNGATATSFWQENAGSGFTDVIPLDTDLTYVPSVAGRSIRLRVRWTNAAGFVDAFSSPLTPAAAPPTGRTYGTFEYPWSASSPARRTLAEQSVTYYADSDVRTTTIRSRSPDVAYQNWSATAFKGTASDPVRTITAPDGSGSCHMPSIARPQSDTDGSILIVDMVNLIVHEAWSATQDNNGNITARSYQSQSLTGTGFNGGMPAADFSYLVGIIRKFELASTVAEIEHIIGITLAVEIMDNVFVPPARSIDGYGGNPWGGSIEYGRRFGAPNLPTNLQTQSGVRGKVARAVMRYGLIVWDTFSAGDGGSKMTVRAEDNITSSEATAIDQGVTDCLPYLRTVQSTISG